ncbi:MAG: DUF2092 domain-containing protein [Gammaproteobacteria bacterium]
MTQTTRKLLNSSVRSMFAVSLSLIVVLGTPVGVRADEADAKRLLKGMSDYLAAQRTISFEYDAALEVVTKDEQILALVSSGAVTLNRPDKIRTTRAGGFADVETSFDGNTLTVLGKNLNIYAQQDVPGTIDHLIDELRSKYDRHLPAANLLLTNAYDALMRGVVDVKDLGSGVVGGVECDFLAFRKEVIDWQIWIAQGERPYPCRYSVTTKDLPGAPQYTIQIRDWKTGDEVAATDFTFKNTTGAKKVDLRNLEGTGDLPAHFKTGESE